jgi:anti-sigma-K factor RskA
VSDRDRIAREPPDCGLDAAPYLLGALDPHEAAAFRRHLERCAVCRDEVAALAPVLDALPAAAPPRRVHRALRRRVLHAVRAEPKGSAVRRPRPKRPFTVSAPAGWLALGLAVAAAVVLQVGASHSHTRVIPASVGRAELRLTGGHGELVVAHLAPLPADRVYELWVQAGRRTMPSTLFAVTTRGRADVGVPGDLHGVRRLMVTVEPRGGSLVPTTPAVIQVPLTYVSAS